MSKKTQKKFQGLMPAIVLSLALVCSSVLAETAQEYLDKGDQAFDAYKLSVAERNYLLALRKNPKSVQGHQRLIRVYHAQQRYSDGLNIADKAIKQNPTNPELWISHGLLHRDSGDIHKSNESYMQAVKYAKDNISVLRLAEDHFYSVGNQMLAREIGIQRKQLEAGANK